MPRLVVQRARGAESSATIEIGERFRIEFPGAADYIEFVLESKYQLRVRFMDRTWRVAPGGGDNVLRIIGEAFGDNG